MKKRERYSKGESVMILGDRHHDEFIVYKAMKCGLSYEYILVHFRTGIVMTNTTLEENLIPFKIRGDDNEEQT